jgi:putative oxidoreductase
MENSIGACNWGQKYRDEAYMILRVVTGLAFFYHGYVKVFDWGVPTVIANFDKMGFILPQVIGFLVSYGELFGGLAIMLGFLTHWATKGTTIIMIGAIAFVHWGADGGWFYGYGAEKGYEYQLLLLAASIFFIAWGSGRYSVDAYLAKRSTQQM